MSDLRFLGLPEPKVKGSLGAREVAQLPRSVLSQPQKTGTAYQVLAFHRPALHFSEVRKLAGFTLLGGAVVTCGDPGSRASWLCTEVDAGTEVNTQVRNNKWGWGGVKSKTRGVSSMLQILGLSTQ